MGDGWNAAGSRLIDCFEAGMDLDWYDLMVLKSERGVLTPRGSVPLLATSGG